MIHQTAKRRRLYNISTLNSHLVKTNDLPVAGLSVKRQVGVRNLAKLERTGLDLAAGDGAREVVLAGLDGEVGQRDIPRVAGRDRRGTCRFLVRRVTRYRGVY
jgi:hypothetical protein